jgi:hypothetical protein
MGDKTFQIRFDKHGNIVIDDAELQQRLKFLLETNGELVLRMRNLPTTFQVVLPEPIPYPQPIPRPKPPNSVDCPMTMCDPCGKLRLVNDRAHQREWDGIGIDPGER